MRNGCGKPSLAGAMFFVLLAAGVGGPARGQGSQDSAKTEAARWTPELCMKFRAVQETAVSPDGSRVAFVVREPQMEGKKSEFQSQVWMSSADGATSHPFTRGEESAASPAFSPDGRWLAFVSTRGAEDRKDAKSGIWIIRMSGGEAQPATKDGNGVDQFRWSPDGTRFAFVATDPDTKQEKKDREEKRDVILVDRDYKYGHLWVVRVDPDADAVPASVRLTAGEFHVSAFDWSPDGTRIVFAHQPDPRINTGFMVGDLSVVTVPSTAELLAHEKAAEKEAESKDGADSGEAKEAEGDAAKDRPVGVVTPLVTWAGAERTPFWSPDGRFIAFDGTGTQSEPIGLGDLYIVPAAGGEPRRLAETPNRRVQIVGWSADSNEVYLDEQLGTTNHVIAVPLTGSEIRHVSSGDGVVGAVSLSRDTRTMAFTWQTTDVPWDVQVSPTRRYAPRRISDLHRSIELPAMGRTELLRWNAPDGTPVEGLLTYPVAYEPGKRYPIILNVHGGPAGVFSRNFTGGAAIYMLQVFAQEGFAVLRPNPRGSTGYGKDFRYANFKDWGYGDLSDLLAGMDRAIEMGVGDPERQLLMGWSYGGYMTSFAVTQTDRFKAASMGAGLPNLVSMVTTTDIGDYLVGHMGGEFWDDYATYEKHSAIYHIAAVKTPTQVIHGQNDLRVPFDQGLEFYRALDRRGIPTEMVVYPRTPHGPREPKFLMDVTPRILTWFRAYMPGTP